MGSVSIRNFTRRRAPRLPFDAVARAVLPGWEISLVFVGKARATALNKKLRRKPYAPNVLSYKIGTRSGEIIICTAVAQREAPAYNLQPTPYTLLLFIHALLHLKGWVHSARMERCEQALLAKFSYAPNSDRHRHRHVPGKSGRGRRSKR